MGLDVDLDDFLARPLMAHLATGSAEGPRESPLWAEVVPLDEDRLHRLLRRYLGEDRDSWNPEFRGSVVDDLDLMVRFVPASVVARNQSYFSSG